MTPKSCFHFKVSVSCSYYQQKSQRNLGLPSRLSIVTTLCRFMALCQNLTMIELTQKLTKDMMADAKKVKMKEIRRRRKKNRVTEQET